jgi:hypothetical protein
VDPNNPQSWNRYAYVGGTPLMAIDPFGLTGCDAAALHRPSQSTNADADAQFGPYDPGAEPAAMDGGDGCYVYIDGVQVPWDLAGELGGAGGGGGSQASHIFGCAHAIDCVGKTFTLTKDDQIETYDFQFGLIKSESGINAQGMMYKDVYYGYTLVKQPTPGGCGWDPFCGFYAGFAEAGVNDNPLGIVHSEALAAAPTAAAVTGAAVAPYVPAAWAYTTEALSSGWNWIANTGIPSVQYAARQFVTNPDLLPAAAECASELLLPEGGPPPLRRSRLPVTGLAPGSAHWA